MKKIIIASSNQNKIQEITQIIANLKLNNIIIESIRDYTIAEPDEPYDDFLNNAIHKAKYYSTIDPIFIPQGSRLTIAELGIDFKNKTSHRAKALHGLMQQLELQ